MSLADDLRRLINIHSRENVSNTPDHILAEYLLACLDAGEAMINARSRWYGRLDQPGGPAIHLDPPDGS